jgi:hypothetical protein
MGHDLPQFVQGRTETEQGEHSPGTTDITRQSELCGKYGLLADR